ncbi:MAG TPA: helix-turn-helix domain-containing protein [Gemmatimonadaceae bacterium]|nr:helix-turn-helix domain-containing protein [Gemmatimonadaceae bacterium]
MAARDLVARGGAAEISMGDVAARASVSKALVLYHFRDKESLLLALAEDVGGAMLARERSALDGAGASHALDEYWGWLESELKRGDLRILLALADYDSERVRTASRRIARERRDVAGRHIAAIFERLDLAPRVPPPLLAETVVAFIDRLAAATALEPARDPRPAFDALWLGLLTLTE